MGYIGMSTLFERVSYFLKTFWSEIEYRFLSFCSQTPVSNWVWFLHFSLDLGMFSVFLEELS